MGAILVHPSASQTTALKLDAVENATALGDGLLEIGEGLEVTVDQRLIQDGPEVLGGLKLGRVPGQVDEPDPIRGGQVRRGVPAGVVENEHDDALASRPSLTGKQRQRRGEEWLGDPVRYVPEHLA